MYTILSSIICDHFLRKKRAKKQQLKINKMSEILGMLGSQALGAGLGIATAGWQDKRQIKQGQKLQDMQIRGAKEMSDYQKEQSMEIWDRTNYNAQVNQMKKAGLNVGLMYGGGGAGGGTTSGGGMAMPSGNAAPSGGNEIGMGIQTGIQAAQAAANLELTKAAAKKTNVEADNAAGANKDKTVAETVKLGTEVESLKQGINNAKLQADIMEYDKQIKSMDAAIKGATIGEIVKQIQTATQKLIGEMNSAEANGEIDQATKVEKIKQINTASTEQALRISTQKMGLEATEMQINKMAADIANMGEQRIQEWKKLDQNEREIWLKKVAQEQNWQVIDFQTSTPAKIRQWVNIWSDIIGGTTGVVSKLM